MSRGAVLVLGGGSDIGLAIARRFAEAGHPIQLAARRPLDLEADQNDIMLRHGVSVTLHEFDALNAASHEAFVTRLPVLPEIAVCAVGMLGLQGEGERSVDAALLVMRTNYEGPASILGVIANHFERRGSGAIVGISSAAGERGRAWNYVYGSAKAGFTAFLSGLRNRLARKGVAVLTVKPGFVATRMTAHLKLPSRLTALPGEVAQAVYTSVMRRRDVIYVPRVWRIIMMIVRAIPESMFKRTNI